MTLHKPTTLRAALVHLYASEVSGPIIDPKYTGAVKELIAVRDQVFAKNQDVGGRGLDVLHKLNDVGRENLVFAQRELEFFLGARDGKADMEELLKGGELLKRNLDTLNGARRDGEGLAERSAAGFNDFSKQFDEIANKEHQVVNEGFKVAESQHANATELAVLDKDFQSGWDKESSQAREVAEVTRTFFEEDRNIFEEANATTQQALAVLNDIFSANAS
jgi:hypothetical protein